MANGDTNGNGRYVTTKWLIAILVFLVMAASSMIIADTRTGITKAQNAIDCLEKDKVDKIQYDKDIQEIKHGINRLVGMHLK
jgi:hypothetical protein